MNKQLNVLYIHQYFSLPDGSSGIRSYKNAIALRDAGFNITILCINDGRNIIKKNLQKKFYRQVGFIDGLKIIQLNIIYSNYMSLFKRSIVFLKFLLIATYEALFGKYQIIYATSTPLTVAIPGIFSKWLRRRKFIFEVRDSWPELPHAMGVLNNKFLYLILLLLEKLAYLSADICIGLAPGICQRLKDKGVEVSKIKNIPNSCDTDIFKSPVYGELKNPKLINKNFSDKDFVVAFTGAHGVANGLDDILNVAKLLKKQNFDNIKFVFIGDGKCKPDLLKRKRKENL